MKQPTPRSLEQESALVENAIAKNPDLEHLRTLSSDIRYECVGYHKQVTVDGCTPQHKPNKAKCPNDLTNVDGQIDTWLKEAFNRGAVSEQTRGGYPAKVWYIDLNGRVFTAKLTGHGGTEIKYHGYPLDVSKTIPKGLKALYKTV